jgi:hypothetical protein
MPCFFAYLRFSWKSESSVLKSCKNLRFKNRVNVVIATQEEEKKQCNRSMILLDVITENSAAKEKSLKGSKSVNFN